jgi:hypothetical protein
MKSESKQASESCLIHCKNGCRRFFDMIACVTKSKISKIFICVSICVCACVHPDENTSPNKIFINKTNSLPYRNLFDMESNCAAYRPSKRLGTSVSTRT